VFLVAGTAQPRRIPILLEREGSDRHSAAGESPRSDVAGTVGAGAASGRVVNALTANGLGGGGPDDNLAQAGHLISQRPSTLRATMEDSAPSQGSTLSSLDAVGGGPRLASSSSMQSVASTVTTGTGVRYDPDTESLVVT
jgi:hypothetical protein